MLWPVTSTLLALTLLSLPTSGLNDGGTDWLAGTDNGTVDISGTQTERDNTPSLGSRHDAPDDPPTPPTPCTSDPVRVASCEFSAVRVTNDAGAPLTITDVAQFAPAPVTTAAEPGGVGVAGLPMNFVAATTAQTRSGTLLGRPITVRFTPARVDFVYGDGESRTSTDGGESWATLGQASFTPTPTSHTYRTRGTYPAHATVRYTAEVDIGGGWFPVPGELAIDGSVQQVRVYEADTALVARTCTEQLAAPGC